jgi:ketosteroid isomerase-like protein
MAVGGTDPGAGDRAGTTGRSRPWILPVGLLLGGIALGLVVGLLLSKPRGDGSPEGSRGVAEAELAAIRASDCDAVAEHYSPDAVYDDRQFLDRSEGREAIRASCEEFYTADPSVRLVDGEVIYAGQDAAVFTWAYEGDVGLDGTPYRLEGVTVIEIRDGMIIHATDLYDRRGLSSFA